MAITRPVTKTIISTTDFGIPVVDAVNANTDAIAALQPTGWIDIAYMNGFSTYPGYAPLSYKKIGNLVFLRGGVIPQGTNVVMGVLPVAVRPQYNVEVPTYGYGGDIAFYQFVVANNGNLSYGKPAATPMPAFLNCQVVPWSV